MLFASSFPVCNGSLEFRVFMEVVTAPDRRAGSLYFLAERLETHANFAEVIGSLTAGHGATLGGVWGSS